MKKPKKKPPAKMVLPGPDDLNDVPTELSDYRILLFGPKAIGKTTLVSKFEGSIVGALERGRRGLAIRQVPLKTWDECLEFRDACIEDDTVRTVAFDTLDVLYDLCMVSVCEPFGVDHPGKMKDFGYTWKLVKDAFKDFFDPLSESGKGVICTSHEKKDTVEVRSGDPYDRLKPTCSNGAYAIVEETFDYLWYYGKHGKDRAISVRPFSDANMEVDCACGPEGYFLDPSGEPLTIFTVPNDPTLAYHTVEEAFNNRVWDAIRGEPEVPREKRKKKRRVED